MAVIAMDLGGTKLASALLVGRGRIVRKSLAALEGRRGRAVGRLLCDELGKLLSEAQSKHLPVTAIGISVPGISYARTGEVWAPNIPGWRHYPLRSEIESAWAKSGARGVSGRRRLPVEVENDRVCCILGETWRGIGKGCTDAIFLTVGTGVGAGILSDGKVLHGAKGIAGAIGWWALDRPFRAEYAGIGCLEYHASGSGLVRVAKTLRTHRRRPELSAGFSRAPELFSALKRGDLVAKEVLAQAIEFWGMTVANLVSLLNPQMIVFGGGIFGPASRFLDDIRLEAQKWAQPLAMKAVRLRQSKLGPDAALYGAGRLALAASSTG